LNGIPIEHNAIINDFFGKHFEDENYSVIYGIYEGLIKFKGVSKEVLYDVTEEEINKIKSFWRG
jgi:hypothetical protein